MTQKQKNRKKHTDKILLTEKQIQERVRGLADEISRDYAGKELTVVAILKGSVIFFSDLVRNLDIHCAVDFISVSSYRGTSSSGVVRLITDLREDPVGKHLLLIEDIVDTGNTLEYLRKNLLTRNPASVRVCTLLNKPAARKVPVEIDYVGFTVPDAFVVGYGLDYRERFRGLPYIGILSSDMIREEDRR